MRCDEKYSVCGSREIWYILILTGSTRRTRGGGREGGRKGSRGGGREGGTAYLVPSCPAIFKIHLSSFLPNITTPLMVRGRS